MKKLPRIAALALTALLCLCVPASAEKDTAGLLATVNGTDLPLGDALSEYEYAAALCEMYGYTEEDMQLLREDVARIRAEEFLMAEKANELGLTIDEARVKSLAQEEYDAAFDYYLSVLDDGVMTDEALAEAAGDALASSGLSIGEFEAYYADYVLQETLIDACLPDVAPTEDELFACYEERLKEEQALFDSDPYYYEEAVSCGRTTVYAPEGFRAVRHILIRLPEAEQNRMYEIGARLDVIEEEASQEPADPAALESEKAALKQEQDDILSTLRPITDEIQARLADGEDFLDLMNKYGEDTGMQTEPYKTDGYVVWSGSYMEEAFLDAALALENEGDVSEPVATSYGLHIIRYERAIPAGPVPYEEVKPALREELEADMRSEAFCDLLDEWYAEADVTLYPENLIASAESGEENTSSHTSEGNTTSTEGAAASTDGNASDIPSANEEIDASISESDENSASSYTGEGNTTSTEENTASTEDIASSGESQTADTASAAGSWFDRLLLIVKGWFGG